MTPVTDKDREIAQELIWKLDYENTYWLEPIAQAIATARQEGREECEKGHVVKTMAGGKR